MISPAQGLDAEGIWALGDLAWIAERAVDLVSHHLGRLRTDGLAHLRRNGKMVQVLDPHRSTANESRLICRSLRRQLAAKRAGAIMPSDE